MAYKPTGNPHGRPTLYTKEIADSIISQMEDGEGLLKICEADGMPSRPTVLRWVDEDREGFSDRYAKAREHRADKIFEETVEIADKSAIGQRTKKVAKNVKGEVETTEELSEYDNVERAKLRVDARKWFLAKLFPNKYGDKQEIKHTGDAFKNLTEEEIDKKIIELQRKAGISPVTGRKTEASGEE